MTAAEQKRQTDANLFHETEKEESPNLNQTDPNKLHKTTTSMLN
jgi:hypothetical protein